MELLPLRGVRQLSSPGLRTPDEFMNIQSTRNPGHSSGAWLYSRVSAGRATDLPVLCDPLAQSENQRVVIGQVEYQGRFGADKLGSKLVPLFRNIGVGVLQPEAKGVRLESAGACATCAEE